MGASCNLLGMAVLFSAAITYASQMDTDFRDEDQSRLNLGMTPCSLHAFPPSVACPFEAWFLCPDVQSAAAESVKQLTHAFVGRFLPGACWHKGLQAMHNTKMLRFLQPIPVSWPPRRIQSQMAALLTAVRTAKRRECTLQPRGCSNSAGVLACAGTSGGYRAKRPHPRQLSEAIPYLDDGFSPDWTSNLPGQTYSNTFYASPVGPLETWRSDQMMLRCRMHAVSSH